MKYKFSEYNVVVEGKNNIIFNTRTLAMGTLDNVMQGVFISKNQEELDKLTQEQLDIYLENGFIVSEKVNERNLLKKEYWSNKLNTNVLFISILTTLDCNFKCPYCFEKRNNIVFGMETQEKVLKFIEENISNYKVLNVDWYGGEPLLNTNTILDLSYKLIDICKRNNVEYQASITTNGFNLTRLLSEKLSSLGVKGAQVTIDGPEAIHDTRRVLRDGKGTYKTILKNVKDAMDFMNIFIRVNVDKNNLSSIKELIDNFVELDMKKIGLTIKAVVSADANPYEDYELEEKYFSDKVVELYEYAINAGIETGLFWNVTDMSRGFCIVDLDSQFIITPDGRVFKCGEAYDENDCGKIGILNEDGGLEEDEESRNLWDKDPFDSKECSNCVLIPICMGGCQMKRVKKNKSGCIQELKYNIEKVLKLYANSLGVEC